MRRDERITPFGRVPLRGLLLMKSQITVAISGLFYFHFGVEVNFNLIQTKKPKNQMIFGFSPSG